MEDGSYVTLIGSDIRIYGIYRGTNEREGKIFHFIELQKGCRQSMHESLVEYMRLTSSRPKNLSTVKQYAQWKESIRPNPLLHVLGRDINLDELKPEVILLSQKKDLERYITETSPMGSTYGSLVGVRYITRKGKNIDYPGAPTKTPLLWCASDPLIVSGLIKESRNGEGENNVRYVIIESGKLALDFVSALAGIPEKIGRAHV